MQKIRTKITEVRQKASGAIEDVPDNLIGTILIVTVLTAIGLGLLLFFGYWVTR
jgi:hypothetical protein